MLSLALGFLAGSLAPAQASSPAGSDSTLPAPELVVAQVKACGLNSVSAAFDRDMDEVVVHVKDTGTVDEDRLRCVAQVSIRTDYYVFFPAAAETAYNQVYWPLKSEHNKAEAIAWLKERGLLERLPRFTIKEAPEQFARAIENVCGPDAQGLLEPFGSHLTLNPDKMGQRVDSDIMACVSRAAEATVGAIEIIGNEAVR